MTCTSGSSLLLPLCREAIDFLCCWAIAAPFFSAKKPGLPDGAGGMMMDFFIAKLKL